MITVNTKPLEIISWLKNKQCIDNKMHSSKKNYILVVYFFI